MRHRRVELDIGSGHGGEFTLAAALECPETLFIGVDINEHSFAASEAERHRLDIDNVQFVHGEAHSWMKAYVPESTIDAFHLYFPTPYVGALRRTNVLGANLNRWLFTPSFVSELRRTAKPGAILRVATDRCPYIEYVRKVAASSGLVEMGWSDPIQSKPFDYVVGTGCEREMRRIGRSIHHAQYLIL